MIIGMGIVDNLPADPRCNRGQRLRQFQQKGLCGQGPEVSLSTSGVCKVSGQAPHEMISILVADLDEGFLDSLFFM